MRHKVKKVKTGLVDPLCNLIIRIYSSLINQTLKFQNPNSVFSRSLTWHNITLIIINHLNVKK